jgi:hypothetical protein
LGDFVALSGGDCKTGALAFDARSEKAPPIQQQEEGSLYEL